MNNNKRKRYLEVFKKEAVMRGVMGQNSSTYSVSREAGLKFSIEKLREVLKRDQ